MPLYKVQVTLEPREDGGLRAWSEDLPELVLSHADPAAVIADIPLALETILCERLGGRVEIAELQLLPTAVASDDGTHAREFAARLAA